MSGLWKVAFCWLIVLLSVGNVGCYMIGDSVVLFEGEIKNESSGIYRCNLSLFSGTDELISFPVENKFSVDYTVESTNKKYQVEVFCVDSMSQKLRLKREVLQLGGKPLISVDLGEMNIKIKD